MKYLYGIAYGLLVGVGVFLVWEGEVLLGYSSIGLGGILGILNCISRRRRFNFLLFLLSCAIVVLVSAGSGVFSDMTSQVPQKITPPPTTTIIGPPIPETITPVEPPVTTLFPETAILQSVDSYAGIFNQYRQGKGLDPLVFTDDLNLIALLRLVEIQKNFSHSSIGDYNRHLGENIAMSTGYLSNEGALKMWEESPGHNANMLDGDYRYTGYAIGSGYAVQVFSEFKTINGEPQLPEGWEWVD